MEKAEKFLIKNGLHEKLYDFDEHVKNITAQMEAGLAGKKSSLLMLPSWLGVSPKTLPDGAAVAIDAGGTNLRVALVRFAPGAAPVVGSYDKYRIPGAEGAICKDEFFNRIAGYVGDMDGACEASRIGFCFSFPCEIGADRDGKILGFNKELKIEGSEGAMIGVELNAAFGRQGKRPAEVTTLNDTVAALIGVVFDRGAYDMGGYIGLIYGTGVNICYYDADMKMLINTEMGKYDGFPQSICDKEIDLESDIPGDSPFEKMVSGAYFSNVALKALRLAAAGGVFSTVTCEAMQALRSLDAPGIDGFMRNFKPGEDDLGTELGRLCATEEDSAALYAILDGLYERAAKLLAISMTAVLDRSGAAASRPAFIVAEGSSFRKGYLFRERFERWLKTAEGGGLPYELALADDHTIIGAAASVFL